MNDSILEALARLPGADSDSQRAERVRARCRARLARSQPAADGARRARARQTWERVVLGIGAAYLAGIVQEALHLYRTW
jgi:hypothetical protein